MLALVVGPSGAGKDTLLDGAREILAGDGQFRFVRREITRPADAGGEAHVEVSLAEFAARRAAGGYALSWEAHGLGYGITAGIIADLAAGRVVVASVSRGVIAEAAARFPTLVLEITAPADRLARRLVARGREGEDEIAARLARTVALPDGIARETVMNDGSIADGVARVVAVLNRAAAAGLPA